MDGGPVEPASYDWAKLLGEVNHGLRLRTTPIGMKRFKTRGGDAVDSAPAGEPSLSIPCYAEQRYGGAMEDELLMALPPRYLPKIMEGLAHLSANGLRYPIP